MSNQSQITVDFFFNWLLMAQIIFSEKNYSSPPDVRVLFCFFSVMQENCWDAVNYGIVGIINSDCLGSTSTLTDTADDSNWQKEETL